MAKKAEPQPTKSWLRRGDDAFARSAEVAEQAAAQRGPNRFFLIAGADPKDSEAKLIVLDETPVAFWEHNRINPSTGKYGMTDICLKDVPDSDCPICDTGDESSYVCVHSVLDTRTRIGQKDGKSYSFEKKLLVTKPTVTAKLAKLKKKHGSLKLALIEFSRTSDKESRTGETLEWEGHVKIEKLRSIHKKLNIKEDFDQWIAPFDYDKIFKVKSREELERVAGMRPPVGRADTIAEEPGEVEPEGDADTRIEDLL